MSHKCAAKQQSPEDAFRF